MGAADCRVIQVYVYSSTCFDEQMQRRIIRSMLIVDSGVLKLVGAPSPVPAAVAYLVKHPTLPVLRAAVSAAVWCCALPVLRAAVRECGAVLWCCAVVLCCAVQCGAVCCCAAAVCVRLLAVWLCTAAAMALVVLCLCLTVPVSLVACLSRRSLSWLCCSGCVCCARHNAWCSASFQSTQGWYAACVFCAH